MIDEVGLFCTPDKFPGKRKAEEGLLKVVIGFHEDYKILQVLLPVVECNSTSFYFVILSNNHQCMAAVFLLQQRLMK